MLHENIKYFRKKQGYTLEEVAEKIGTTKQTISRYEKGEILNIPLHRILSLAKCFDVAPEVLVGWNNDKELQMLDEITKEYVRKFSNLSEDDKLEIMRLIDRLGR